MLCSPTRTIESTLLIATWNIREFDSATYGPRSKECLFYIAEIISSFDLVAVQEVNKNLEAIYFSRSVIPFNRNKLNVAYYKHIGMYAYKINVLFEITKLQPSSLELSESLEQLRWLENGYKIQTAITNLDTISIDTKEDLEKAVKYRF